MVARIARSSSSACSRCSIARITLRYRAATYERVACGAGQCSRRASPSATRPRAREASENMPHDRQSRNGREEARENLTFPALPDAFSEPPLALYLYKLVGVVAEGTHRADAFYGPTCDHAVGPHLASFTVAVEQALSDPVLSARVGRIICQEATVAQHLGASLETTDARHFDGAVFCKDGGERFDVARIQAPRVACAKLRFPVDLEGSKELAPIQPPLRY